MFIQNLLMKKIITYTKMIVNCHKCLHITAIEVDYCANESTFQANNCQKMQMLVYVNTIECYCLC